MACSDFGIGSPLAVVVALALMLRNHCCQVSVGSEKEAPAALVGFVDALAVVAPLETATVIQ